MRNHKADPCPIVERFRRRDRRRRSRMGADERATGDEQYLALFAAGEEAVAEGQPADTCRSAALPEVQARLERDLACVHLLRKVLARPAAGVAGSAEQSPRPGSASPVEPGPAARRAWPAVAGYEILGELGRGGMGVVYRARQVALDRLVALKMILAGDHAGEQQLARFRTEAEAVARFQHPNIVQIHEIGETDGLPWFSLELCEGGSLADQLDGTPRPARPTARLVEVLARAIHAAHRQGIIHRDLKPANVLLAAGDTPKITDFGLAKRLDGGTGPTASGAILGTPSYMAPEQAGGQGREVGPATDVYALGAILYELLTGRPPFKAATPLETVLQVRSHEPVPPSRLQPGVPRDLETIVLKCLHKEPARRYASAEALADDLRRFQAGQPIRARPVGPVERGVKWVRRNPLAAGLAVAVLLLVLGGGGTGLWWREHQVQQAQALGEQARAVGADLKEVARLLRGGKPAEAGTVLVRAEGRVAGGAPEPLQAEVRQMREALDVAGELDRISARKATLVDGRFDWASADRDYARLFQERGLAEEGEDPGPAAERIRGSPIQTQLVAALDDWALSARNQTRRNWLLRVARRVDPGVWSDRFRDAEVWGQREVLERLAREAPVAELSPRLVLALGETLRLHEADPIPLLKAAQRRHPADFWLNLWLGAVLQIRSTEKPEEAIAYCRAALALRPDESVAHSNLGTALAAQGQVDEAIEHWRKALAINPTDPGAHFSLGTALLPRGQVDEAIEHCRQAVALGHSDAAAHNNLGLALKAGGQVDEAMASYRRALAIDPRCAAAYVNLGQALGDKGQVDEAIEHWHQALAIDPRRVEAHSNLGQALKGRGRVDEAIEHYRQAVALTPRDAKVHISLGVILCDVKHDPDGAIPCFRQAIALDPGHAPAHYNLGNALMGKGQTDEAIRCYRQALEIDPGLAPAQANLGTALRNRGQLEEAIQAYRRALVLDPRNFQTLFGLASALKARGEADEAIKLYRQVIALAPGYVQAHHNLGNALLAQGQVEEAIRCYRRALEIDPGFSLAHRMLGDALLRQGRFSEARDEIRRYLDLLSPTDPVRTLAAQQLRQCERLLELDEKLPALLEGKAKPAEAELLPLAQLCQQHKKFLAAATRFYVEAFAEQPRLAEDLRARHRYNAACAAALAAGGQGQDADTLTDQDRMALRRRALTWLRADLAVWRQVIDQGAAQARPVVQRTLRHWQKDPDLAGLRDKEALARLPAAERAACSRLWADVAALLQRSEGPK
jgi:serine/threonine-protein kinase